MSRAVYAASLDPITNGHLNIIERTRALYSEVLVLVAVDSRKNYTFSPAERVEMAKAAVAHLPNVQVEACVDRYVVKYADEMMADAIIRGIRNGKDLEDELTLAEENRRISPKIETVWLPCLPHLMHVSSSMVKAHVGADPGWEAQVARSVPEAVVGKLKENYIRKKAQKHWARLMQALGNPIGSDAILKDVLAHYAEPHRAYHNLVHILSMLDEMENAGLFSPELAFAIWFHDIVYDPLAKDNEKRSAEVAKHAARTLGLLDSFSNEVDILIMGTVHISPSEEERIWWIIDLDLAILGKPAEEFDAYEAGIRAEYGMYSDADFRAGRAKILQSFLDRVSIYTTPLFRKRYEDAARSNLRRSIKKLTT